MAVILKLGFLLFMCIKFISSEPITVSHLTYDTDTPSKCELQNISSFVNFNEYLEGLGGAVSYNKGSYPHPSNQVTKQLLSFTIMSLINITTEKIPPLLFQKFPNLKNFIAENVKLQNVSLEHLQYAVNLKALDLSHNQIKVLENMIFLHAQALEHIDLSHNEISWIHDNVFERIGKNLTEIDLSFNMLVTIQEDSLQMIFALPQIKNVSLQNNKLIEIVPSNKTFEAHNSTINLNLQNNQLSDVKFLSIKVDELQLQNNSIGSLTLQGFVENLQVDNNKLKELFIKSETVTVIADHNEINAVKCENDPKLETLSMSGNKIGNKVLQELKKATKLKQLDLSNTSLESVGVDSFSSFEELLVLNLERNSLKSIEYGLFSHQKHLKVLNISYNFISSIDLHVLFSMVSLESLNISGNQLSMLNDHEHICQTLPRLSFLGIEANNWNCDYLLKLRISLKTQNITDMPLVKTVKNSENIWGVGCIKDESTKSSTNAESSHTQAIVIAVLATVIVIFGILKFKKFLISSVRNFRDQEIR